MSFFNIFALFAKILNKKTETGNQIFCTIFYDHIKKRVTALNHKKVNLRRDIWTDGRTAGRTGQTDGLPALLSDSIIIATPNVTV